MSNWLLVSDLDETLLGDPDAWAEFCATVAASPNVLVALNSSRPWTSVVGTLLRNFPPLPLRASITAMGTEVRVDGKFVSQWNLRFSGWDRRCVDQAMLDAGFEPHPSRYQTLYKASFTVPRGSSQLLARNILANLNQECHVVASGQSDFDILPPQADKGEATLFLADYLGVPIDRLIVAGDSANDQAMFDVVQKGIVVGNARAELRHGVDPTKVCFATGVHAAGVLEGLNYWNAPINRVETAVLAGKE